MINIDSGLSDAVSDTFVRFLVIILDAYIRPFKNVGIRVHPPRDSKTRDI